MAADPDQAKNTDRSRRSTNAFIGGIAGVVIAAVLVSLAAPSADGGVVIVGALVAGLVGAVIGWSVPKAS